MSALQVPFQLIQKGSWDKGKHMAVISYTYNGSRVTMWSLAHQDHLDPLGIGKQELVESWMAGRGQGVSTHVSATPRWRTHVSPKGHSSGEHDMGCQRLSIREMADKG